MEGFDTPTPLEEQLRQSDVVRLRHLPFSTTEADVAAFFRGLELGPDGVVICINFRGRNTGHAFVQFASADIANKALEWDRQQMGKVYVEVYKAHAADMQGALRMVGRRSINRTVTGNIVNTGIPGMAGHSDMNYTGVIRIKNVPWSCTSADIVAFFKGMEIVPDGIFHCTHPEGRPCGEAYVEFADEETAARAMRMNHEPFGNRYVELYLSTKGDMMTAIQKRMYNLFAGKEDFSHRPAGVQGQQEHLEPFRLQGLAGMNLAAIQGAGLGISGIHNLGDLSQSVCIKMKNLPYNAQTSDIAKFFDGYRFAPNGIHMVFGVSARPTGEAFVEFISVAEAARAMERHRSSMGSRYIELLRATKCEMLIALGTLPGFDSSASVDPGLQLVLLQQQAATGAFGRSDAAANEKGHAVPAKPTAGSGPSSHPGPSGLSAPTATSNQRMTMKS